MMKLILKLVHMPENEFEKKVSSEMQALKFKPSDTVWLRVEERIRKKNKRRVFVILFLLAGLALLGYWQWDELFGEKKNEMVNVVPETPSGEKQNESNSATASEINNTPTNKQNTATTKQEETKNTTDKTQNETAVNKKPAVNKKDIVISKNNNIKPRDSKQIETKSRPAPVKTEKVSEPAVSIDVISSNTQKNNTVSDDTKVKDPVVVKDSTETIIKQDGVKQADVTPLENKNVPNTPVKDSAKTELIEKKKIDSVKKDTLLKADPERVSPAPIATKDPAVKKWKWGLHLTPGISSLNDHSISLFSGLKSAAFDFQTPQAGTGSGAAAPRQRPVDIKPGFAFQAGAFVQRQLSRRTSFSTGLQYAYYSNTLRVGNRRDSLLNNSQFSSVLDVNADHIYNAGGDTVKFTNSYHFIELPLRFQWQLNKSKTNPFVWSTGLTVGQLLASNAVMYDTSFNGIYYKNNRLLNKTQFNLSTGFSWTIANGKRTQWSLGPIANIHLNRLVDSPFENKGYLFFAGVRTSILFNKKK